VGDESAGASPSKIGDELTWKSRSKHIAGYADHRSGIEHGVDACLAVVTHDQANELLAAFVKSTAAVIPDLDIVVVVLQVARIGVCAQIAPFSNGGIAQEAIVAFVRIRLENDIGNFATATL